eukprot:Partr_v1_DN28359_c1_g1_i1_m78362 putative serine incorporator
MHLDLTHHNLSVETLTQKFKHCQTHKAMILTACCFSSHAVCCCLGSVKSSLATRTSYALTFAFWTCLAWILQQWGYNLPGVSTGPAASQEMWSYLLVMRFSFALVIYHSILCVWTFGIGHTRSWRAPLHNGYWGPKLGVLLALTLTAQLAMPDRLFYNYHLAALVFSAMFILLQSVLLVDFAWAWSERWIEAFEETSDEFYRDLLIGVCSVFFAAAVGGSVWMLVRFSGGCVGPLVFVGVNLGCCLVGAVVSVLPVVQEVTPRSGLFQASVLSIYCTYLVASALISMPSSSDSSSSGGDGRCSLSASGGGASSAMVSLGVMFTFLGLGYSAFSSGSTSFFELLSDTDAATAADGDIEADDNGVRDDEVDATQYSYSFFHFTFVLASFYMAMVITDWEIVVSSSSEPGGVAIVHGMSAMWVKVAMSWACHLLYWWTLVAPVVLVDRDFGYF